jgi:glycosyltransferase involved in cell wall biosynthesis
MITGRPGVPQLVIAGRPGWAYGDTLARIKAEPGVRYLGHVYDATLTALYDAAAVLAFPSLYEGFGLPLLEAMAHGIPAVIGNAGALPELADGAGVLVDPEDVTSIAAGLERVLADASLRDKLGAAGRLRASEFTWSVRAAVTREVLSGSPLRPNCRLVVRDLIDVHVVESRCWRCLPTEGMTTPDSPVHLRALGRRPALSHRRR